jgi:hypothetical protein
MTEKCSRPPHRANTCATRLDLPYLSVIHVSVILLPQRRARCSRDWNEPTDGNAGPRMKARFAGTEQQKRAISEQIEGARAGGLIVSF